MRGEAGETRANQPDRETAARRPKIGFMQRKCVDAHVAAAASRCRTVARTAAGGEPPRRRVLVRDRLLLPDTLKSSSDVYKTKDPEGRFAGAGCVGERAWRASESSRDGGCVFRCPRPHDGHVCGFRASVVGLWVQNLRGTKRWPQTWHMKVLAYSLCKASASRSQLATCSACDHKRDTIPATRNIQNGTMAPAENRITNEVRSISTPPTMSSAFWWPGIFGGAVLRDSAVRDVFTPTPTPRCPPAIPTPIPLPCEIPDA